MDSEDIIEDHEVILKVANSSIGSVDSGLARINSSHLSCFDGDIPDMVNVTFEKKTKTLKLVSDRLAQKDAIILREGDIKDLKVNIGDEVRISPYTKLTDEMKEKWIHFKDNIKEKFRGEDEKEEEKQ